MVTDGVWSQAFKRHCALISRAFNARTRGNATPDARPVPGCVRAAARGHLRAPESGRARFLLLRSED